MKSRLQIMAETKIDQALMDLVDIELAKSVKCAVYYDRYGDHNKYWQSDWVDAENKIVRVESFNDDVGYEIQLPCIHVIITPYNSVEYQMYRGWKVIIMTEIAIKNLFLTGKTGKEDAKKEDN